MQKSNYVKFYMLDVPTSDHTIFLKIFTPEEIKKYTNKLKSNKV